MNILNSNNVFLKNLHLTISVCIIIPTALMYGLDPKLILWKLFDIKEETVNLISVFRAIMGLYLGISLILVFGILDNRFWAAATVTNILFMGGLAIGRLISLVFDGMPSALLFTGLIVELLLALWGFWNLIK